MLIHTSRFGALAIEPQDILHFQAGLPGLPACNEWVLLADASHDALGWLQSSSHPEIALAVVSPRRFVPNFQMRVAHRDLEALRLADIDEAQVLVIVASNEGRLTVNLKAPLVFNLREQRGVQVVAKDDHSLQHLLPNQSPLLRKSA